MPDQLAYECPLCRKTVHFAADRLGEVVDCPECHKQFRASAPLGRAVSGGNSTTDTSRSDEQASGAERTLRTIHPVVYRNRLFLTSLFCIALALGVIMLIMAAVGSALFGLADVPLIVIGAVLLLGSALFFVYHWIQSISTTIKVTTERTIVIRGIVSKSTNEVQHDDVRNIRSDRNLLERMFNYGDLALSSSGQDDMEIIIEDIPDPQGVIDLVRRYQ